MQRSKKTQYGNEVVGYLQVGYVQVQWSVCCSDSWCLLKLAREILVSSFSDFCNSFQWLASENWKERWPKGELALGLTSEIYLLERVLRVGAAMETSELR
jgi:hypothetical protein